MSHARAVVVALVVLGVEPSPAVSAEAVPASCREALIVHHSHFDVGYTHPQPVVWELHKDFIEQALGMLESTADWPEASRPRWTCEVTAPLLRWLETAGPREVDRFAGLVRAGRPTNPLRLAGSRCRG